MVQEIGIGKYFTSGKLRNQKCVLNFKTKQSKLIVYTTSPYNWLSITKIVLHGCTMSKHTAKQRNKISINLQLPF